MYTEIIKSPKDLLLIEDNTGDVVLVQEALRESGISCRLNVVKNGSDAIDFLRHKGKFQDAAVPDIIILDLNLPRKNGKEILTEIKADEHLKSIPVIVLTSSEADQDILRSYQLHANCYITKPTDFDEYIRIIKAIQDFWFCIAKLPPKNYY